MRLVIALGGNALLKADEPPSLEAQRRNMARAAKALAPVLAAHQAVITHGNGPQLGWLARRPAMAPCPLDMLDAETEGMLGYLIELELRNALPGRDIVTLLSQVAVDPADPAFASPTKPVGPVIDAADADRRRLEGEVFRAQGRGYRRVVPSPAPQRLLGIGAVSRLIDADWLVICAGGGGIPVSERPDGGWRGVEAVVDKDATSALLAAALDADRLLLLTDVDAVYEDWASDRQRPHRRMEASGTLASRFEAGTMGPKVAAACDFVLGTGRHAAIGALEEAAAVLGGRAGTQILPQSSR